MENRTIDSKKKLFSQSRDQEKMINKMKEVADGAKKVGTTGRDVANQLGRAIASAKSATSAHTSAGVIDEGLAAGYDPDY
jgi:hypothetical protein